MRQIKSRTQAGHGLPLYDYLPYRFSILAEAMSRFLARRYVQTYGLKRHEWRVLHILSDGSTMSTQQIIEKASLDRLRVSRAAISLESKGLLARVTNPGDQRAFLVSLTPRGRALFQEILPTALSVQSMLLGALDKDDRESLDRILIKLTEALTDG